MGTSDPPSSVSAAAAPTSAPFVSPPQPLLAAAAAAAAATAADASAATAASAAPAATDDLITSAETAVTAAITAMAAAAAAPPADDANPLLVPVDASLVLRAVPRLVTTAAKIGVATVRALTAHAVYGPPHDSWSWLTTATRAFLRSAVATNPPDQALSLHLGRSFTRWTFPTSPHHFVYAPTALVMDAVEPEHATSADVAWTKSQKTTAEGQACGHVVTGEWVLPMDAMLAAKAKRDKMAAAGIDATKAAQKAAAGIACGLEPEIDRVILYIHGGAFHFLSGRTHRCITSRLVSHVPKTAALALHQRLGPEHSHNAAVEDLILAYLTLIGRRAATTYTYTEHPLANLNFSAWCPDLRTIQRNADRAAPAAHLLQRVWDPKQIVLAGDSSGGNTVASALLVLKHCGYPLPGTAVLLSPWLDPTSTSASWRDNHATCYLPADLPGIVENFYRFSHPFPPTHPFVSPLYATRDMLRGLPPILVQVGANEVLRDESLEWGKCLAAVGSAVRVEVYDGGFHAFHAFPILERQRSVAFQNIAKWLKELDRAAEGASMSATAGADAAAATAGGKTSMRPLHKSPKVGHRHYEHDHEARISTTENKDEGVTTVDMAPPSASESDTDDEDLATPRGDAARSQSDLIHTRVRTGESEGDDMDDANLHEDESITTSRPPLHAAHVAWDLQDWSHVIVSVRPAAARP
ncbi:hypothetical protein AMAG_07704 [Allomyces macrogynus ATCC 38327]|uniref:Alpha/beta hydrolase fold-3 domain-containing protein n=1 Tax=Allomyces macrogynus (strain ATCC 38327) TaxID=578462 RepID=A0A0L0SJF4_ALLM3|nr:hypothetical protein AMAG_07704 [Allomyces macrogynus ATCC 38327]|eukprot:KNE62490.1 hypothetical protein AMAG_07704 [Allomyces macrogynus ATCC 38327]